MHNLGAFVLREREGACDVVIAGLDPAIHRTKEIFFDGCAGQARA
jgi:hypothetical protein